MQIEWKLAEFEQLSLEQLYQALSLRQQVFIVEQDCPYNDADGLDQACWHLLGYTEVDGKQQLVAYSRIVPAGLKFDLPAIGRVVTSQSVRREGAGKQLMAQSIQSLQTLFGSNACRISAQMYLLDFYQSFGFEEVGASYLEDGIPHVDMVRQHSELSN